MARRIRQADIIRAEYPTARNRYFNDLNLGLQKSALEQNQRQFDAQTALQRQAMEDAQRQADQSQIISTLGLAKSAYPYLKKGASGLARRAFGSEKGGIEAIQDLYKPQYETPGVTDLYSLPTETGVGEAAAPTGGEQAIQDLYKPAYPTRDYQSLLDTSNITGLGEAAVSPGYEAGTAALLEAIKPAYTIPSLEALYSEGAAQIAPALGAGEAAIPVGEAAITEGVAPAAGGAGGGLSWWGGPAIAAAALGQIAAASGSKPVEGVAPGHFFSTADGNWKPRFAEPDKNYFSQQLGGGPTTGARFDARLQKGDIGGALKALPGFAHGYAIPGLDVAGNVVGGYATRQFGERAGNVAQSIVDPVGALTSRISEAKDIGDVASTILDPIGVFGGTHFCTAITNSIGMSKIQTAMMRIFRNWCLENHRSITEHYMQYGGELVQKIKESIGNEQAYFAELKKIVVDKVLSFMAKDDIQSAYKTYREKYLELLKIYTPELFPGLSRAEMP